MHIAPSEGPSTASAAYQILNPLIIPFASSSSSQRIEVAPVNPPTSVWTTQLAGSSVNQTPVIDFRESPSAYAEAAVQKMATISDSA